MKKYCLTLDLKDDEVLIRQYDEHHKKVWPEIIDSIKNAGICNMEIYRLANRLFMIVEADDDFSFETKSQTDAENEKVQQWEELMWNYQQPLKDAKAGEKWKLMHRIFNLKEY